MKSAGNVIRNSIVPAAGYGIQCSTSDCVVSNIEELHSKGATIIKIPLIEPLLENELLTVEVERDHTLGLKVVSHAMNDNVVQLTAQMNMDFWHIVQRITYQIKPLNFGLTVPLLPH